MMKVRAYKTYQSKKYFGKYSKRKKSKFQRSDDVRKKTDEVILLICLFRFTNYSFSSDSSDGVSVSCVSSSATDGSSSVSVMLIET